MTEQPAMQQPRVSIVVPAYEEGDAIIHVLERFAESVELPFECVVVVDFPEDSTVAAVEKMTSSDWRFRVVINTYGRGPANAIRFGIDRATAPVIVVTMADGSDDPKQIDDLVRLVDRGVVVAAASRYMPGGQQVGAAFVKSSLSRAAGVSLKVLTGVGTSDATNSFKAYSTEFVRDVGIESRHGFEIGLELTAKARRLGLPVAQLPTVWLERTSGVSNFKLTEWIPRYLYWYRYAFGPRITIEKMREQSAKRQTSSK